MTKVLCAICGTPSDGPRCPRHPARNETERSARRGSSGWARQKQARGVIERDGGICYLCGKYGADEVDHIQALALEGDNDGANLRAVHSACHRPKSRADTAQARDARGPDAW